MSVWAGLEFYLPVNKLADALKTLWELSRLPPDGLKLEHELTLPDGTTIGSPFRSCFDEPPYIAAVNGSTVSLDATLWCPAPDWAKPGDFDGDRKVKRKRFTLVPLDVSIRAGQRYAEIGIGGENDRGAMVMDEAVIKRLSAVAKAGQAVVALCNAEGERCLIEANFTLGGALDLEQDDLVRDEETGEIHLDDFVDAVLRWLNGSSEAKEIAAASDEQLPPEATVAQLASKKKLSHDDGHEAAQTRYRLWQAVLEAGETTADIRQRVFDRDPTIDDSVYEAIERLATGLLPYDIRKEPTAQQQADVRRLAIESLRSPELPLPPPKAVTSDVLPPPSIPAETSAASDRVFLAAARRELESAWRRAARHQAAGKGVSTRMVAIQGLKAALGQLAYCSDCDVVRQTQQSCHEVWRAIALPLAVYWKKLFHDSVQAKNGLVATDAWWLLQTYASPLIEKADRDAEYRLQELHESLDKRLNTARKKANYFQEAATAVAFFGRRWTISKDAHEATRRPHRPATPEPSRQWSVDCDHKRLFSEIRLEHLLEAPPLDCRTTIYNASAPLAFIDGGKQIIAMDLGESGFASFDTSDGKMLAAFQVQHKFSFPRIVASADEQWFVVTDGTVVVWRTDRPAQPRFLPTHAQHSVFTADSRYLITNPRSARDPVRLWSLEDESLRRELTGIEQEVYALVCSPTQPLVAMQTSNAATMLVSIPDGRRVATFGQRIQESESPPGRLSFSPDGQWLAIGATDRIVEIWNVRQQELQAAIEPLAGSVSLIDWTSDSRQLVVAGGHGFGLWTLADGKCARLVCRAPRTERQKWQEGLAFFRELASKWEESAEALQDAKLTEQFIDEQLPGEDLNEPPDSLDSFEYDRLVWSQANELLAVVHLTHDGDTITGIRSKFGDLLARIPLADEPSRLAFSPDGKLLATEVEHQRIDIWNITFDDFPGRQARADA